MEEILEKHFKNLNIVTVRESNSSGLNTSRVNHRLSQSVLVDIDFIHLCNKFRDVALVFTYFSLRP